MHRTLRGRRTFPGPGWPAWLCQRAGSRGRSGSRTTLFRSGQGSARDRSAVTGSAPGRGPDARLACGRPGDPAGSGWSEIVDLVRRCAALVALALLVACSPGAAGRPTPTSSLAPASPTQSPTPSPTPLQRAEQSLPVPIEEAAAAAAGGKLFVMGGFNAAGASLNTVYVFD